jgi:hypothetical protein
MQCEPVTSAQTGSGSHTSDHIMMKVGLSTGRPSTAPYIDQVTNYNHRYPYLWHRPKSDKSVAGRANNGLSGTRQSSELLAVSWMRTPLSARSHQLLKPFTAVRFNGPVSWITERHAVLVGRRFWARDTSAPIALLSLKPIILYVLRWPVTSD